MRQKRIAMPQKVKSGVLQTGQDQCWDTRGNRIPANGTGQDGEFQKGILPPAPRFVDNNDGTVSDKLTGLIWLKDSDMFGEMPWADALVHARELSSGAEGVLDNRSE